MAVRDEIWLAAIRTLVEDGWVQVSDVYEEPSRRQTAFRVLGAMEQMRYLTRSQLDGPQRHPTPKSLKYLAIDPADSYPGGHPKDGDFVKKRDVVWHSVLPTIVNKHSFRRTDVKIRNVGEGLDVSGQTVMRVLQFMEEEGLVAREDGDAKKWHVGPVGFELLQVDRDEVDHVLGVSEA